MRCFLALRNIAVSAIFVLALFCGALFTQVLASQATPGISNTWTVTIVLPPRLMAGHPATLGVLGVDGKLAAGVQVDLGNGLRVTTDRNGRALFTAPVVWRISVRRKLPALLLRR